MDGQPDFALRIEHTAQIAPRNGKVRTRLDGLQIAGLPGVRRRCVVVCCVLLILWRMQDCAQSKVRVEENRNTNRPVSAMLGQCRQIYKYSF